MSTGVRDAYLESEILEASGVKLIQLMYRKALDSLALARRHLAEGSIGKRSREITRVSEIFNELALALDHDSGGEVSRNLVELYDYVQTLLHQANYEQSDPPLAEAETLLRTLLEAWQSTAEESEAISPAPEIVGANTPLEHIPVDATG